MDREKGMREFGKWGWERGGEQSKQSHRLFGQTTSHPVPGRSCLGVFVLLPGFSFLDESGTGPVPGDTY